MTLDTVKENMEVGKSYQGSTAFSPSKPKWQWKYYIPIYGWIVAIQEWRVAVREHSAALDAGQNGWREFNRTCRTYENTLKGFAATIGTLGLAMPVVMFWRFL